MLSAAATIFHLQAQVQEAQRKEEKKTSLGTKIICTTVWIHGYSTIRFTIQSDYLNMNARSRIDFFCKIARRSNVNIALLLAEMSQCSIDYMYYCYVTSWGFSRCATPACEVIVGGLLAESSLIGRRAGGRPG